MLSRYYYPEICRWISPDSIEYLNPESINGLNLYAYCGNDPINKYDPAGHFGIWAIIGIVGAAILIGGGAQLVSNALAGELNQVMYKGYVFKTYEGRLIQAGFRGASSSKGTVTMESYVFEFSVEDKEVADSLMRCSGKSVELHYKEYLGALPWRGQQKYVVDKILSVK